MLAYDIGDTVRVGNSTDDATNIAFTDAGGVAADPTTVTLTLNCPDGTTLVYGWPSAGTDGSLTQEATGRFFVDLLLGTGKQGVWHWRLVGSGDLATAVQGVFFVRTSVA